MKQFLVILGLTAMVWLGVSMSEVHEYPMRIAIRVTGYDTVKYAVVQADTALDVHVQMAGLNAFTHNLRHRRMVLPVQLAEGQRAVAVATLTEGIRRSIGGAKQVSSECDSIRVVLAERACREYEPRLDEVAFSFIEQYGLSGDPQVVPEKVALYGPEETLSKIADLHVALVHISNIGSSATYRLPLTPVWEDYADVHPSTQEVELYVPVEAYVEREFHVPIHVYDADTTVQVKLYPEVGTVRAWVPQRYVGHEPAIHLCVNYHDVLRNEGSVAPQLHSFPSYVRPKSIEPKEVQCVIIR